MSVIYFSLKTKLIHNKYLIVQTTQSKLDTKQDSKATGSVQEKHIMTDKPQNGKNQALPPTTRRVVSQVNVMKTLLASYKRNTDLKSEYVRIEFAKRPEGKKLIHSLRSPCFCSQKRYQRMSY